MPWRPGLMTAGQRTTVPELEAWKLTNAHGALDGMIRMRPALDQWAQTIKAPDPDATGTTMQAFSSFISGTPGYVLTDASSSEISTNANFGELKTNINSTTAVRSLSLGYDVTLSANTTWSLRFLLRATNLEAYANTTAANTFAFRAQGSAGSGKEFAAWSGGLYYKQASDSKYVLITGTELIGSGSWVTIEVRCDSTANTTVYINDTLVATLTSSDLDAPTFNHADSAFEFDWETEWKTGDGATDGVQYATSIVAPMYSDTDDAPFIAQTIVALSDFQYLTASDAKIRSWVMAAGNFIYHDKGLQGAWRPLHPKQHQNVFFAPYRTSMAWTDNNGASQSALWLWDGVAVPELQDDAPPVRFITEHQQRLLGWGDIRFPRRLYYAGDRLPNVWFSPSEDNAEDQFDTLLDAGYQEIRSYGIEIRGVVGDYYGQAIIAAENGYWKLTGSGVFSYRLDGFKAGTGTASALSLLQVGDDVWIGGSQGITSLLTTEKFGGIQAGYPSIPIQNLWTPSDSSDEAINQTYIDQTKMAYNASRATVYIAVPHIADRTAAKVYEYSVNTKKFYGPGEFEATAMATGELASPITEVVMFGGSDGRTGYLNPFVHRDYREDSGRYTMTIQSAAINGRSEDTRYVGYVKVWRTLRLFILPRAEQTFDLSWWTDTEPFTSIETPARSQSEEKVYTLDRHLRLDLEPGALLRSGGELAVHEIELETSGRDFTFLIESDYDMPIQGWELEATISGFESDD